MKLPFRVSAVSAVALGALLHAGCDRMNEENLGGQTSKVAPRDPNVPDFKSDADAYQYQLQQAVKAKGTKTRRATKGAAAAK
jgi:hypothetical protein